jgi:ABC-2 type transport system ATP-binding protein
MATIQTHNLTRCFDNFIAVDHVDLSVASGEIFGLLGPNAAGKSTIIRILSGILRADAGRASILGMDLFTAAEQIKRRIGYVAQHFALYPDLTVEENLAFYGGLYGVAGPERRNELLETYDLTQFGHRRAGLLSGGYQRRLAIAAATMHDPELIFLDEPTAGIDPVTRKEL